MTRAARPASGLILAALLVPAIAAAPARAEPAEALFNLVTLSAQAEREVPNDQIVVLLAAESEGADPAPLADAVNRAMQRALAAAKAYRAVNARTGAYQSIPLVEKGRVGRWRVRQELRLESQDFAATAELVGKLQAGLTVAAMSVTVSAEARRQAESALVAEAIGAFEERVRTVREAMRFKSHRVRELQVGGGLQPRPYLGAAARGAVLSESIAAPAIQPGTTTVTVTVSGTVQMLP